MILGEVGVPTRWINAGALPDNLPARFKRTVMELISVIGRTVPGEECASRNVLTAR